MTTPEQARDQEANIPPAEEKSGTVKALDATADKVRGVRRALTINEDDPFHVGALKILGMVLVAILLLGLSPLIILGLMAGFAAAA